jgi:hypothetical protein
VRLDVAMQQTSGVHGRYRVTEWNADLDNLRSSEALALLQNLFERTSVDELHPQADLVSDPLCAVDSHNVRMPNLSQQAAFFDDGTRARLARTRTRSSGQLASQVE